jgi:hypothetical protein
MQYGSIRCGCRNGINHARKDAVLDLDRIERILGAISIGSENECNRLAECERRIAHAGRGCGRHARGDPGADRSLHARAHDGARIQVSGNGPGALRRMICRSSPAPCTQPSCVPRMRMRIFFPSTKRARPRKSAGSSNRRTGFPINCGDTELASITVIFCSAFREYRFHRRRTPCVLPRYRPSCEASRSIMHRVY